MVSTSVGLLIRRTPIMSVYSGLFRSYYACIRSSLRANNSRIITQGFCRHQSTAQKTVLRENAPGFDAPTADGAEEKLAPKIVQLVDEIGKLTLLEVADLNKALKRKLNLPDAPMMTAGMMMAGAAAPAKSEEDDSAPAVAATKTKFSVKLTKIDDSKKIAVIKEVKSLIPNLNLVQAKKFVESLPQTVKSDLLKDEADKMVAQFTSLGATCEVD